MRHIHLVVTSDISHQRLDKYLAHQIQNYSRESIIKAINQGDILVNSLRKKPSYLLKNNDLITGVLVPPRQITSLFPLDLFPQPEILYENDDFLIINKPAGINTHPTLKNLNEPSIASWLVYKYPQATEVGEDKLRPGIVHRLDKDTSGALILAKTNKAFFYFKNLFLKKKIEKKYFVLARGEIKKNAGEIDFPITKSSVFIKKKIIPRINQKDIKKIKPALTIYRVIKRYQGFTFLEVMPKTGRTHQIRVHLASIGFPVAGDRIYGRLKKSESLIFPRQFLHASEIAFLDLNNKILNIQIPLPGELKNSLQQLKAKID